MTSRSPEKKYCPQCGLESDTGVDVCPRDGSNLKHILDREPVFAGKYQIQGVIGAGGMGLIYQARQLALNKWVAIKMMHAHLMSEDAVRRFQIEGKAVGLLSHPYIVSVHDLGTTSGGQPFMVMDFIEGKTLAQVLERDVQISKQRFLRIFAQVGEALMHAHKRGVLHRDLKPSNIMLVRNDDSTEEVRIMDFGIAKLISDTESGAQQLTKTGEAIGSPIYMSPEQARGMKADARADLYSLGCVMYEALTGTPPFVGNTPLDTMLMHLNDAPLPLREASLGQDIDPRIEQVVMKLLAKEPADRYQSMAQIVSDLNSIQLNASPVSVNKPSSSRGAPQTSSARMPLIAGSVAVVATLLGIGAFFAFSHARNSTAPNKDGTTATPRAVDVPPVKKYDQYEPFPKDNAQHMIASIVRNRDSTVRFEGLRMGVDKITKRDMLPFASQDAKVFIRILHISGTNMTDDVLEPIQDIPLDMLVAAQNPLRDLRALKHMYSLRRLELPKTDVDRSGLTVISKLKNLEHLDLSTTLITDDQLPLLYGLKKLRVLMLHNCKQLSPEALKKLQEALPNCLISAPNASKSEPPLTSNQRILKEIRDKYMRTGQWAAADRELQKFQRLIEEKKATSDPDSDRDGSLYLAETFFKRALCLHHLKNQPESDLMLQKSLRIWEGRDPGSKQIALRRIEYAKLLETEGVWKRPIELRKQAREFWEDHPVDTSSDPHALTSMLDNLQNLGLDYVHDKDDQNASLIFSDELSQIDHYGLGETAMASFCANILGDTYLRRRLFRQALPQYKRAYGFESSKSDFKDYDLLWKYGVTATETSDYITAELLFKKLLLHPATPVQRIGQYSYLIRIAQSLHRAEDVPKYVGAISKLKAAKT